MDTRRAGAIRRADFGRALAELGASVEFQRTAQRTKLAAYFHDSARDLSLEDFVRRAFPTASPADMSRMLRWASLRKARNLLTSDEFKATKADLREVYSILEDETKNVSAVELLRARILSRDEVLAALPPHRVPTPLGFDEFCKLTQAKFGEGDEDGLDKGQEGAALSLLVSQFQLQQEQELSRPPAAQQARVPAPPTSPPASPPRPQGLRHQAAVQRPPESCRRDTSFGFVNKHLLLRAATVKYASE